MLTLKTRNITKSVIVATVVSLLCTFIFIPLFGVFLNEAVLAIEKSWETNEHTKALIIIYGTKSADMITFGISGFLMGAFIVILSKSNLFLTTMLSLLLGTAVLVIYLLEIVPNIANDYRNAVLINLGISFLIKMVFFWGCVFLVVWLVSHKISKNDQQSLKENKLKVVPDP